MRSSSTDIDIFKTQDLAYLSLRSSPEINSHHFSRYHRHIAGLFLVSNSFQYHRYHWSALSFMRTLDQLDILT